MKKTDSSLPKPTQLRRCGSCQKVGHNRSRCSFVLTKKNKSNKKISQIKNEVGKKSSVLKSNTTPLHFFVHHVTTEPPHSPHVVDLKKDTHTVWEKIQSASPEKETSFFQDYHTSTHNEIVKNKQFITQSFPEKKILLPETKIKKPFFSKHFNTPKINSSFDLSKTFLLLKQKINLIIKNFANTVLKIIFFPVKKILFSVGSLPTIISSFNIRKLSPVLIVLIIALIVPGPTKSYYASIKSTTSIVAEHSTEGFMALQESTAALLQANLPSAEESTIKALQNFNSAVTTLEDKHQLLQKIISTLPVFKNEVQSRQNLIMAGQKITLGNTYLLKGIEESKKNPDDVLTKRLHTVLLHLQSAIPNYDQALTYLETVSPDTLPLEYQTSFKDFKTLFTAAVGDFKQINELGRSLEDIFGGEGLRRYLLIFQNPDEIRATGGFMGSFAEIDVKDGKIVKITVPPGGTYDIQGQLQEHVEPPSPFLLANKRWEFQDANWFPDFKTSAEKILWFYRHAGKGSVDGVIAINSSVLTRLLALMGPITDEKRNVTLTNENAIPLLQKIVEEGPEKKNNEPKKILSDLAPQFITYLQNIKSDQLVPLLANLKEALDQKEIQVYFSDNEIEERLKPLGWTGQLTTSSKDYLMVVNTNIRGQKSDARIKQKISHQTVAQEDGSIVNTVVITRTHTGIPGEKFYGAPNINYLRLYVPEGSELLEASGFEFPEEKAFRAPDSWTKKDTFLAQIEKEVSFDQNSGTRIVQELGKTSFGNWVLTEPGETSQIQFSYRLPFKIFQTDSAQKESWQKILSSSPNISSYQLMVQRQSGSESTFESQIIFPEGWQPLWEDGSNLELASNGASLSEQPLLKDSIWNLAMQKNKK